MSLQLLGTCGRALNKLDEGHDLLVAFDRAADNGGLNHRAMRIEDGFDFGYETSFVFINPGASIAGQSYGGL